MDNLMIVLLMQNRDNTMLTIRRRLRDISDPFSMPENEFRSLYSLSREVVRVLIDDLRPFLPAPRRRNAVPVELQVLSALNFIASGSYQKRVGQDYLSCISQPTVSKILRNVVNALNILMEECIKFPIQEREVQQIKETYWTRTQFPGIIGAIDGTHVAIVPPNREREHLYINRKLYHSLNVLLVSDYEGRILTVNAAHGGRTHDARVWRASLVSNHLEEIHAAGRRDAWLLGDSAYPLLPYLMTPKLHEPEGTPSARYTQHHVRARCSVERCIGVLKGRWRCLRKERALHYAPEVAAEFLAVFIFSLFLSMLESKREKINVPRNLAKKNRSRIVNATCVLHNIAVHWRLSEPELYYDEIDQELPIRNEDGNMENGNEVRERIIHMYFDN